LKIIKIELYIIYIKKYQVYLQLVVAQILQREITNISPQNNMKHSFSGETHMKRSFSFEEQFENIDDFIDRHHR
jgi:hypothetical protein